MKTLLSPAPRASAAGPSGVVVIDKPTGWTSHDVVVRVRRILKTRKVGHTGTLDPLGTGVLPICVGDATKLAGFAQAADKVYRLTMRLGVATDTQDSMGQVTATTDLDPDLDWDARVREQLASMVGESWQTPPMYAAVKVGGEPLYRKARRGETVEREARRVTIYRGNVVITQGTLRIEGETVTIHYDAKNQMTKLVTLGDPAHFRQLPDGVPDEPGNYRVASAKRMEYYATRDLIVLLGDATYGQRGNRVTADRIVYDSKTSRMKAETARPLGAAPKAKGPAHGGGRVHIKILPKKSK